MKILIISHDASRSGAPILLLNLIKAYKERRPDIEFDFIIRRDGPLVEEFQKIAKRILVVNKNKTIPSSSFKEGKRKVFLKFIAACTKKRVADLAIKGFIDENYNLIFSNTITNGAVLKLIQPHNCKVFTYVHELENTIRACTSPSTLLYTLQYTNHFLVPSKVVGNNLSKYHGISPENINLLHYYVPEPEFDNSFKVNISQLGVKKEILIGAMGTLEWRKGADLFIQVALQLRNRISLEGIKFIWIGVDESTEIYKKLTCDIFHANLSDHILLVEKVSKPLDYLSKFDIFLMTSREDPYPLVVLEAAMLKKPIICFDNAGGASEFLAEKNGIVVPYIDVDAMVGHIVSLLNNEKQRGEYGDRARKRYLELHTKDRALDAFEVIVLNR